MRKVHIDNKEWLYFCGKGSVKIIPPDRKSIVISYEKLMGKNYDVDRAKWKRYLHITPSLIKNYILENIK